MIQQSDLRKVYDAEKKIAELEEAVKVAKTDFKNRLEAGEPCEYGGLVAAVTESSRRSVPWKEEFERLAGEQKAQEILEKTLPTISRSVKVSVRKEEK